MLYGCIGDGFDGVDVGFYGFGVFRDGGVESSLVGGG